MKLKVSENWESKFETLKQIGILSFPDWDSIQDSCYTSCQIDKNGNKSYGKVIITDGTSYTVELLMEENKRRYRYPNPYKYSGMCKNSPELQSFIEILRIISSESGNLK